MEYAASDDTFAVEIIPCPNDYFTLFPFVGFLFVCLLSFNTQLSKRSCTVATGQTHGFTNGDCS